MTLQSPRVYTYKITFEEVPYYYYGVHKENKFNERYWGRPITNKWCWKFYTPKKQILEIFDYSDEGWLKAQEVEKRIIKPFYKTDKNCLNCNCGGMVSYEHASMGGKKSYKLGLGIHGRSKEQMSKTGKISGEKIVKLKLGIHGYTKEQITKNAKKGGEKSKKLGLGFCGLSLEERQQAGRKGAATSKKLKVGIFGLTQEQRCNTGKKIASQRWMCLETGFIANAGNLARYQRARDIDTSKRKRLD